MRKLLIIYIIISKYYLKPLHESKQVVVIPDAELPLLEGGHEN